MSSLSPIKMKNGILIFIFFFTHVHFWSCRYSGFNYFIMTFVINNEIELIFTVAKMLLSYEQTLTVKNKYF